MEELSDEDVHLQHVRHVLAFHVPQDVDEPLEVAVRRADPQEVDLLASDAGIPGNEEKLLRDLNVLELRRTLYL